MKVLPIEAKINVDVKADLTLLSQAAADVASAPTDNWEWERGSRPASFS